VLRLEAFVLNELPPSHKPIQNVLHGRQLVVVSASGNPAAAEFLALKKVRAPVRRELEFIDAGVVHEVLLGGARGQTYHFMIHGDVYQALH
jgi:hypothetical protein